MNMPIALIFIGIVLMFFANFVASLFLAERSLAEAIIFGIGLTMWLLGVFYRYFRK